MESAHFTSFDSRPMGMAKATTGFFAVDLRTLDKLLKPDLPLAHNLHVPSGEVQPIWEVAQRYRTTANATAPIPRATGRPRVSGCWEFAPCWP